MTETEQELDELSLAADRELSQRVYDYFWSQYPVVWISSVEGARVEQAIRDAARLYNEGVLAKQYAPDSHEYREKHLAVRFWDVQNGFRDERGRAVAQRTIKMPMPGAEPVMAPATAVDAITMPLNPDAPRLFGARNAILVLRNFDEQLTGPAGIAPRAAIYELGELEGLLAHVDASGELDRRYMLVILSPTAEIPQRLAHIVKPLEIDLPTIPRLEYELREIAHASGVAIPDGETVREVSQAMAGMTCYEARGAMALALRYSDFQIGPGMLPHLRRAKAIAVRRNEAMRLVDPDDVPSTGVVKGFDEVINYTRLRALAYTHVGESYGLDLPKGLALVGPAGSGKSVFAQAISSELQLPAFLFDVGAVFKKHVGESEAHLAMSLKQISAQNGAVLIIDEADKLLGGMHKAEGDSGVTSRVFGRLLSWLSEKKDRTFVILTMNTLDRLPPELTRTGRFDRIFYTDFPCDDVRQDIFRVHATKRGFGDLDAIWDENEWRSVLEASKHFVGSEIEQAVVETHSRLAHQMIARAVADGRDPRHNGERLVMPSRLLIEALEEITPVYTRYERDAGGAENLKQLYKELQNIAKPAYIPADAPTRRRQGGRKVRN